jgi:hypothetical protein
MKQNLMKKLTTLVAIALAGCASTMPTQVAEAQVVGIFDSQKYCRDVAAMAGGSYMIEEACRKQEYSAMVTLSRRQIPPRIEKYCRDVGQMGGGSYWLMNACVDQELAAKGRMQ